MVVVKCDNCGKVLKEPVFRLVMTDGQMTKEAQFCTDHAQKIHDAVMRFSAYGVREDGDEVIDMD